MAHVTLSGACSWEAYQDPTFEGPQELYHILFHFCWNLTKPKNWLVYLAANSLVAEIYHNFLPKFDRFHDYYLSNVHCEHLHKVLTLPISEFGVCSCGFLVYPP